MHDWSQLQHCDVKPGPDVSHMTAVSEACMEVIAQRLLTTPRGFRRSV